MTDRDRFSFGNGREGELELFQKFLILIAHLSHGKSESNVHIYRVEESSRLPVIMSDSLSLSLSLSLSQTHTHTHSLFLSLSLSFPLSVCLSGFIHAFVLSSMNLVGCELMEEGT